jgi:hypothetical protein
MAFVLIGLPLIVGSCRSSSTVTAEDASAPPVVIKPDDQPPAATTAEIPSANPEVAPVADPAPAPMVAKLSPAADEVVRMAQSGVNEDVMLAFVANAKDHFGLGSEQIIYLNDLGIPGTVVKAMLQRDTGLNVAAAQPTTPPTTAVLPAPPATAYNGVPTVPQDNSYGYPPPTQPVEQPAAPAPTDYAPNYSSYNASYYNGPDQGSDYFYGSLAPYGNWVEIGGYGRCWQPMVCTVNRNWRPYCDQGRWLNTDSGWYWQSDYSWGWAPFHYGRWFCDDHHGWVWHPDRVWAPAWVSWRRSSDYCGWAPLPPQASFVPGIGFRYWNRSVGVSFEFGLNASCYTFVPVNHFADYAPYRHRVSPVRLTQVYNQTTVINNITVENNKIINHGIDPKHVAAAAHTEIRKVVIRDVPTTGGHNTVRGDHLEQSGATLAVFRPHLPSSNAGHGVNPSAPHHNGAPGASVTTTGPSAGAGNFPPKHLADNPSHTPPAAQPVLTGAPPPAAPTKHVGNLDPRNTTKSTVPLYIGQPEHSPQVPQVPQVSAPTTPAPTAGVLETQPGQPAQPTRPPFNHGQGQHLTPASPQQPNVSPNMNLANQPAQPAQPTKMAPLAPPPRQPIKAIQPVTPTQSASTDRPRDTIKPQDNFVIWNTPNHVAPVTPSYTPPQTVAPSGLQPVHNPQLTQPRQTVTPTQPVRTAPPQDTTRPRNNFVIWDTPNHVTSPSAPVQPQLNAPTRVAPLTPAYTQPQTVAPARVASAAPAYVAPQWTAPAHSPAISAGGGGHAQPNYSPAPAAVAPSVRHSEAPSRSEPSSHAPAAVQRSAPASQPAAPASTSQPSSSSKSGQDHR